MLIPVDLLCNNHETIKVAESVVLILYVRHQKDTKNNNYHLLKLSDFWIKSSNSIFDYYLKNGFTDEKVLFFSLITEDTFKSLLPHPLIRKKRGSGENRSCPEISVL